MLNRRNILFTLILFLMVLSACAPQTQTPGQNPQQPSGGMVTKDKAPFAVAAKTALSQKLGIAVEKVGFVSADGVDWTDSCLGGIGRTGRVLPAGDHARLQGHSGSRREKI